MRFVNVVRARDAHAARGYRLSGSTGMVDDVQVSASQAGGVGPSGPWADAGRPATVGDLATTLTSSGPGGEPGRASGERPR